MPVQPTANPAQTQAIQGQANLASSSATSLGNQITVLGTSITSIQNAVDIFQARYNFWEQYITAYLTESRYLNGPYQTSPIVTSDFTNFLAHTGRLYSSASLHPVRVAEFDNTGATSTDPANETVFIQGELSTRTSLLSGISGPAYPVGVYNTTTVTTGTTVITVENLAQTQLVIPTGEVILEDAFTACLLNVVSVIENHVGLVYTYTLNVTINTSGFGTVGINGDFLTSFPGFTNSERTTNIATDPRYQNFYNQGVSAYKSAVSSWQASLAQQIAVITGNTGEDAPDVAYINSLTSDNAQLLTYLTPTQINVSDSGLAPVISIAAARTTAIPTRTTYISTRLVSAGSYDSRYKYGDKLYNLVDGQIMMLSTLQGQQAQLATQQTTSTARAASLQAELP
jgi:hypothetical protein